MKVLTTLVPWAPLVARVLVGGMFVMSGMDKVTNFTAVVAFAGSAGLPSPGVAVAIAIAVEVLAGLSVLLGYRIFWGAVALAVFTVIVSFVFHGDFTDQMQQIIFTKNMGIVATLLYMMRFGSGKLSIEK
ncbi:MAG: DoxX family protein [Candidatus Pacebacteria bacterium]|nr:DoxX family protein [Candidatus Paceibacterota bacterium]